jgi:hypothetical protein
MYIKVKNPDVVSIKLTQKSLEFPCTLAQLEKFLTRAPIEPKE